MPKQLILSLMIFSSLWAFNPQPQNIPIVDETYQGSAMLQLDSDGDGISDKWEKRFGRDPFRFNTSEQKTHRDGFKVWTLFDKDKDGVADLIELAAGSNPMDKTSYIKYGILSDRPNAPKEPDVFCTMRVRGSSCGFTEPPVLVISKNAKAGEKQTFKIKLDAKNIKPTFDFEIYAIGLGDLDQVLSIDNAMPYSSFLFENEMAAKKSIKLEQNSPEVTFGYTILHDMPLAKKLNHAKIAIAIKQFDATKLKLLETNIFVKVEIK